MPWKPGLSQMYDDGWDDVIRVLQEARRRFEESEAERAENKTVHS